MDLLQRISTGDLTSVRPGEGAATILTNEKGRTVDVVGVLLDSDQSLLLATSGDTDGVVARWLDRFIIMEDVTVRDVSAEFQSSICYVWNREQTRWLLPPPDLIGNSAPFAVWRNSWRMIVAKREEGGGLPPALLKAGASDVSIDEFHAQRVLAGVPWMGFELTDQRHPLEARMRSMISFTKGCYVGQEVVARLDTYRKVQQVLTRFSGSLPNGLSLPAKLSTADGTEAGVVTTRLTGETHSICALGFVRTALADPASELTVAGVGRLLAIDATIEDGIYQRAI